MSVNLQKTKWNKIKKYKRNTELFWQIISIRNMYFFNISLFHFLSFSVNLHLTFTSVEDINWKKYTNTHFRTEDMFLIFGLKTCFLFSDWRHVFNFRTEDMFFIFGLKTGFSFSDWRHFGLKTCILFRTEESSDWRKFGLKKFRTDARTPKKQAKSVLSGMIKFKFGV